ncbi:MAG: M48 family metallopeptidase [Candidatus Omnitrophota bacterium]
MSSDESIHRSKRYAAVKIKIFITDIFVTAGALLVFQLFLSEKLSIFASFVSGNFYVGCFFYCSVFLFYIYTASFPLHLLRSFFVEHGFSLSKQSFSAWVLDEIKSALLSFILSITCVLVFYAVLINYPRLWWVIISGLWIMFSIVLTRFFPVFIIPLFFKYSPLGDEELKERLLDLARRAGISLDNISRIDFSRKTKKANAALTGLGNTRKVILTDTLMEGFSAREIESVVAHEFGHFKYRHLWRHLVFSGAVVLACFFILSRAAGSIVKFAGAAAISDLYLFPVLFFLMLLTGVLLLPLQNFFSRFLERQADIFALRLTNDPDAFISMMNKLARMNLAEISPSPVRKFFLYDHPPVGERIHMAELWKDKPSGSVARSV